MDCYKKLFINDDICIGNIFSIFKCRHIKQPSKIKIHITDFTVQNILYLAVENMD